MGSFVFLLPNLIELKSIKMNYCHRALTRSKMHSSASCFAAIFGGGVGDGIRRANIVMIGFLTWTPLRLNLEGFFTCLKLAYVPTGCSHVHDYAFVRTQRQYVLVVLR